MLFGQSLLVRAVPVSAQSPRSVESYEPRTSVLINGDAISFVRKRNLKLCLGRRWVRKKILQYTVDTVVHRGKMDRIFILEFRHFFCNLSRRFVPLWIQFPPNDVFVVIGHTPNRGSRFELVTVSIL